MQHHRIGMTVIGAIAALSAASAAAPLPLQVPLAVRYPAQGPRLELSSDPAFAFHCASARAVVTCTAQVPRRAALTLRARTLAPAGASSASAASLPIDGKAWGGACAGTPADVCRLRPTRALTVLIDTRDL